MRQIDREIDRYLALLRTKIAAQGLNQLEIQDILGWGRSYISQILHRQKGMRIEQLLLILNVIGVDPAAFFGELHGFGGTPAAASEPRRASTQAGSNEDLARKVRRIDATLQGLVGLLLEKRIISARDLRASVQESIGSSIPFSASSGR